MKTQYFFEINGKISSCFSCPFHFSDGDIHCVLKKSIICLTYEKPSKCPLVELPPHGRLIDADKLEKQISASITDKDRMYGTYDKIEMIIENAPTILEASKQD